MTSPTVTLSILLVLWLIVVVPMVVRRKDDRAGERSVRRFGAAMRALGARRAGADPVEPARVDRPAAARVTVPGAVATRPVPAARESVMYPPDRNDMSEARRRMLARRRRSLSALGGGAVVFFLVGMLRGGALWWGLDLVFVAGVAGYLWFLRTQALRDRDRREQRQLRAEQRPRRGYDITAAPVTAATPSFVSSRPDAVVRIDDDDVALSHIDTVDLTGLYSESDGDQPLRRSA